MEPPKARRRPRLKLMESTAQCQAALQRLRHDGAAAEPLLERLATQSPYAFRTASFAWVRQGGEGAATDIVLRVLHRHGLLLEMLVNPGALPLDDAIGIAKLSKQGLPKIDEEMAAAIQRGTSVQASRTLRILCEIPLSSGVLPALAVALNHEDAGIRSLVAKLYGKLTADQDYISSLLKDADPRVRSNTVEALWESPSEAAGDLLQAALDDPHRRVAANAALGLYKRGEPRGLEALEKLAAHEDRRTRISAAWAIGQTADKALIPLLERMSQDEAASVCGAAMAALRRLTGETSKIEVELSLRALNGKIHAQVSVFDPEGRALLSLHKEAFRVFDAGVEVFGFDLRGPADRERLVLAYVLDNTESMAPETITEMNAAVLKSVRHKGAEDICRLYKFSDMVEAATGFTSDLARLEQALQRAHVGGGSASRILDAVDEALDTIAGEKGVRGIVILSDGVDRGSRAQLDHVTGKARASLIPVHTIAFGPEADRRALKLLASKTQGSFVFLKEPAQLEDVYQHIFDRFASGYEIIFKGEEEPPIAVEVRVSSDFGIGRADSTIKAKTASRPKKTTAGRTGS